ncbi:MAG: hypothetical protein ACFCU5_03350 [Pleurocapsa sp.]
MVKRNNQNSNSALNHLEVESLSNTKLIPLLTNNSINYINKDLQLFDSHFYNTKNLLSSHLDYIRLKFTNLLKTDFTEILDILGIKPTYLLPNTLWHPSDRVPKHKHYKNKILSDTGLIGGYNRKALNSCQNGLSLYDLMIDIQGSYLANLSLSQQIRLLRKLNSFYNCKCTRIDLSLDDYTYRLIPVLEMLEATLNGDNFGFKEIDDKYFEMINGILTGALAFGSRTSDKYIRIYDHDGICLRFETEYKGRYAETIFRILAELIKSRNSKQSRSNLIKQTIANHALDAVDFRDRSSRQDKSKASTKDTKRLEWWQDFRDFTHQYFEM